MNINISRTEALLIQEYLDLGKRLVLHYDPLNTKAVLVVDEGKVQIGEEVGRGSRWFRRNYNLFADYRLSSFKPLLVSVLLETTQDELE